MKGSVKANCYFTSHRLHLGQKDYGWRPTSLYVLHLCERKSLSIPRGSSGLYSSGRLETARINLIENMSGKKVQKALVKRWRWKKTEMTAASAVLAADQRVAMTGAKVVTMADFSWSSDGARCVCKETAEPQNITDAQAIKTVLQELLSHYKAQTTGGLLLQMLPHDYWAG